MQPRILRCQECGASLTELGVECRYCGCVSVAARVAVPAPVASPSAAPVGPVAEEPRCRRIVGFLKSADTDVSAHWGPQFTIASLLCVGGTIGSVFLGMAIDWSPGLPIVVGLATFVFWVASAGTGDKPYMEKIVFPRLRQLMQEDQVDIHTVRRLATGQLKEGSALRKELDTSFSG